jgi:uncharacterized MAPEG superfamily protein
VECRSARRGTPAPPADRRPLARAQANFFETFPIFAAAALIVAVAGLGDRWTALGAWIWLGARLVYLPLYALGVPVIRTIAFLASIVGILLVLRPALAAALG